MAHRTVRAAGPESPATEHGPHATSARARAAAAVAGCAGLAGALIMFLALVAAPGPWLRGYISEAGTAGLPLAATYRVGLLLLAAGAGLLGLALRSRLVALLLGAAAVFAATSGAVPCSSRCPLPPFEPTTAADVVHAAATIVAAVLLAAAMVAVALGPAPLPAVRRLAAVAAALIVPLGGALGLIMLLAGRGPVGAALERLVLLVGVGWLVGTSLLTARRTE